MLAALPIEKTAQAWNVLSKEPHVGVEFVMTHLQLTGLQGFYSLLFHATRKKRCL
ncbi:putative nucleic acid binding protein (putative regulator) [Escherichia coli]|uniref:Putative nucleic acid binding protein (Putative regulator) n=1 Tax=Escherichia coli TaxID=562 RepID=A0A377B8S7_ECOLX|nr:putative nucleic acid binding protein (putative regulator) [Escherichia coli]